jgi:hypothetical protein
MFKRTLLACLAAMVFFSFTGIASEQKKTKGYLQVIFKSCECGMSSCHIFSCYAPFTISGNKITGTLEIPEDGEIYNALVPLVRSDRDPSEFEKQIIVFAYKCPPADKCPPPDVSGELIVHKVSGEVIKVKGKRMLHFVIRLSKPECRMKVCDFVDDCSMEPWSDEFLAPFQDGYHTNRSTALFNYVLNLQTGNK